MPQIALLNQETIDKIAAGEVIERPSSVVKELVENAIDAGANAVTVEIKEGGIAFIRITDNGCGIGKEQIPLAFLRHSTSKIHSVEDLLTVRSLGFRGEALSSIAAISQVELITKTPDDFLGVRYLIEGSKEQALEEIGAPDGTTFLVRNLFYNTPARRKFLKSPQTEGSYIFDLMQKMILSHPDVSFKFILNGQVKLQSSGNGNIKDIIYHIYGREIAASLFEVKEGNELFSVTGYIGKPQISRGNRNYETYFINGRYIKSSLLSKAIEEAYKPFLMQHQYPFTVLYFQINSELLDVNVHPTKMELRFSNQQQIYEQLVHNIKERLTHRELIPEVPVVEVKEKEKISIDIGSIIPEPFEKKRLEAIRQAIRKDSPYEPKYDRTVMPKLEQPETSRSIQPEIAKQERTTIQPDKTISTPLVPVKVEEEKTYVAKPVYEQTTFLDVKSTARHKIIGQVFDTYWLVEFDEKLYIIDQHAAHEKVLFERMMKQIEKKEFTSQRISPPMILTVSMIEEETLKKFMTQFEKLGYEIEHFGGNEYAVSAVPGNMYRINTKDLMIQMLDEMESISENGASDLILERVASMSCKAAVKGNQKLSRLEMEHLIDELLSLENPYNCPHGRPTIISMTKYELEKKFKRIL
jgi:DNA mismatch repair protein MutL